MRPIQKLLLLVILLPYCTQGQVITTVAGNGIPGYAGDWGAATAANINRPRDVAVDKHGNVFFTEGSFVIRKIDTAGIITTVAGTGIMGFSGDGGYAVGAQLGHPRGLCVDKTGNIYFVDHDNGRIRKVDTGGIITTIAGTGTPGYNGDSIMATAAQINYAIDVATDTNGNIYIPDYSNYRIRKIAISTGIITTIAGNGTSGFSGDGGSALSASLTPGGITIDQHNNIYFFDSTTRVRKITASGIISTIAGNGIEGISGDGGSALSASISTGEGIAVDDTGNVYIAQGSYGRIRKINTAGIISAIAGALTTGGYSGDGGDPLLANIGAVTGVAVDNKKKIYIASHTHNRVRCIDYSKSVGVTEVAVRGNNSLSLSPNPVTGGVLKVLLHSVVNEEVSIRVTDVLGKAVLRTTVYTNTESNLPLRLPAGVYYLEAVTGVGRVAERIVVE